jgi:hypothetical protein
MAFTLQPPRLPPANEPVIDPATGQMTPAWLAYFDRLVAYLSALAAAIP